MNILREFREVLKPKVGPVLRQRRERIFDYAKKEDWVGLSKTLNTERGMTSDRQTILSFIVDTGILGDGLCSSCKASLRGSLLRRAYGSICAICVKMFCRDCITNREINESSRNPLLISCCLSCKVYIDSLQRELDPWLGCAKSSSKLFYIEKDTARHHAQLLSRLTNFEGLIRMLIQNVDQISKNSMTQSIQQIEESIKEGIAAMKRCIKELEKIECPDYPPHRDELIKRGLLTYLNDQLSRLKTQFNMTISLYERISNPRAESALLDPN